MEVDLVVCGGGLAGLSAALMAGRMGFSVALVEKKTYPFHKVCGEYLSLESRSLICRYIFKSTSPWWLGN
jgi:flavin-dependent dehydrogenase